MGHIINPIAMRIGWFSNWVDTFFVKLKYYPEYLHSILRLRNYLFFFVRQERFEGIGLFHSHFVIFQKYNYIYINIFIYDGVFHTKKSELAIEMNNLFNLYKRSPLLKNLLNIKRKKNNSRIASAGLLDDTYYLYKKAAESWTFMQLLLCYCIMTNKSNNAFINISFDFITFKKKHPFFNVKLFFTFLNFFNKNKWNAFLRLFKNRLKYKVNNDIKFFNNVNFFNNLYNKTKTFDIENISNLKLTSKKFLTIFIFWFKSKLSISTYNNIKDLNFSDIKFILSNIFPEYFKILNLVKSKAYFIKNKIFHNIFNKLFKKIKIQVFLNNFNKRKISWKFKAQVNGFNIIRNLIVFYKYAINYYKLIMYKRKKNKVFRFLKRNSWINFLYYSVFLNVFKSKHKSLNIKLRNFYKFENKFIFKFIPLNYIYKNKKRVKKLPYSFLKVNSNISYYYNGMRRYYSYLYFFNLYLILYNKFKKLQNISKKVKLNIKLLFLNNYLKNKFFCFKTKKFINKIFFTRKTYSINKFNFNVINNQYATFLKSKAYWFRFYSWKKYYYFHKYAYKTIYKSKFFYKNYKIYLRTKSVKLMQNNNFAWTPYYSNYFLTKNNVVLFFFPINYYKKKLLYEQKKAKLLQSIKPLTLEEKKLLRNLLKKRQINFKKILKLILYTYNFNLKKINLLVKRKKINLVFKAIFCLLKFYYNKIYYFIIDSTSIYKFIFNKINLLKRCCWILESILFFKLSNKIKKLLGKIKKLSFYSVLKKLKFYKKKSKFYTIKKNINSIEQNKINIFLKFILKMHNLNIIKLSYWNETPKQNLQNVYDYLLKYKNININYKNWHKNLNIFMKIIRNRVFISNNFHNFINLQNYNELVKKKLRLKTNYKFLKYKNPKFLYQDHAKHDYWYKSSNLRHKNDIFFKFNWRFFVLFSILLKKRYLKISKNPTYTENLTLFLISLLLLYKYIIPFFNKLLKFTTICLIKLIKYYPLKISYLLINNNQVTGRFLSRYIALKLKNGYSVWELLSPIKKDLNYVRSLTARPNFSFFSGYLKSLRDDFHLNKYNSGIFIYLLKFFCFFYNKQAFYFYNNILFSWLNLDLLFFSTSLYNNIFFKKQIKISCSLLYFLRRSFFTLLMKNKNELSHTFKKFVKDSDFLIKSGIFFNNFSNYLYDDFFSPFEALCIWDLNSNIYVTHKCLFLQNVFFNRYLKHFKYKYSYIDVINYFEVNKRNLRSQGWRNNLLGLLGFKISCSGRFSRRDRASHISFIKGKVPLNTLKAKIDYGMFIAPIKNSAICVKVWLNKGFNYVNFEKKISL